METSDLTDERLAELEAMAKAATPGPRRALPNPDWSGGVWAITANPEHNWIQAINAGLAKVASKKNALFIAATDPDAVLSLIAEVRRLRTKEKAHQTLLREGKDAASRAATLEFELKAVKGALAHTEELLDRERAKVAKLRDALDRAAKDFDALYEFCCEGLEEAERCRAALAETEARNA